MNLFKVGNESYLHKAAKQQLKAWFDTSTRGRYHQYNQIGDICIKPGCRDSGVFLEYPICTGKWNSWEQNWDEMAEQCFWGTGYVPTYHECLQKYSCPIAIIDVVLSDCGCPKVAIEICHKNPVSNEKIDRLTRAGVDYLIEIDAYWIMKQTKCPSTLKYKRLI
jgi:hypothetical protein